MKNLEFLQRAFATAFMLAFAGCTADATQFMLLIESNLEVETELTKVQLTVNWQNETGESPMTRTEEIFLAQGATTSADKRTLPLTVAVVPRPEKLDGNVRFFVEAFGPTDSIKGAEIGRLFTREVRTSFVPNQRKVLQIFLARRCLSEDCKNGTTCTENGCVSPVINSADLPDVNNDSPIDIKIENQKPSQPGVQILDGKPVVVSTSTLSCTLNRSSKVASDDSAIPKYEYQWSRQRQGEWENIGDPVAVPGKILAKDTLAGDAWRCSVTAVMGEERSAPGFADVKIRAPIVNTPPSSSLIASVSIDRSHGCGTSDNPRFASTIGTIRCDAQLNSSFSGELSYGWFVDDIFRELGEAFSVASFDLQGGEEIRCRACVGNFREGDMGANSTNCRDSAIYKANIRPMKPQLSFSSSGPQSDYHFSGDSLRCDLDLPPFRSYRLSFIREVGTSTRIERFLTIDTEASSKVSESLEPEDIEGGDEWSCSAIIEDECGDFSSGAYTRTTILRDDLVGYWPLDEVSLATTDITGNFTGMSSAVGVTPADDRVGGQNSLSFEQASANISISDPNQRLAYRDQYTMCAWVYPELSANMELQPNVVIGQSTSMVGSIPEDGFSMYVSTVNLLYAGQSTVQEGSFALAGTFANNTVIPQAWSHICARYDGNFLATYINGRRAWDVPLRGATVALNSPLFIGSDEQGNHFRGRIDDVKIWSTALPETEICRQAEKQGCVDWVYSSYSQLQMSRSEVLTKIAQEWVAQDPSINQANYTSNADNGDCNFKDRAIGRDYDEHPMNCINYNGAEELCRFYSARLPTLSELALEKNADSIRNYPWGNIDLRCGKLVMADCGAVRSRPACSKTAGNSASGLCDLAGNVAEWTMSTTVSMGGNIVAQFEAAGGHYETPQEDKQYFSLQTNDVFMRSDKVPTVGIRCVKEPIGTRANAAKSCAEIFVERPDLGSGHYWLDDDKQQGTYQPFQAFCQKKGNTIITWVRRSGTVLYYMRTEATVEQYKECVNNGNGSCSDSNFLSGSLGQGEGGCNYLDGPSFLRRFDFPMNCVNYDGAAEFCSWVGGILPTEDEWLDEASVSDARPTPWGGLVSTCGRVVMSAGSLTPSCDYNETASVCSKLRGNSQNGACDMWGNVKEWVRKSGPMAQRAKALGGHFELDMSQVQANVQPQWNNPGLISDTRTDETIGFRCIHEREPIGDDQQP